MDKQTALAYAKQGKKITHRFFEDGEYLQIKDGQLQMEEGYPVSHEFWQLRSGQEWEQDWSLVAAPTPPPDKEAIQPNYKGAGNHSVLQLEKICEQYKEYVHLMNSGQLKPAQEAIGEHTEGNITVVKEGEERTLLLVFEDSGEGFVEMICAGQPTDRDYADANWLAKCWNAYPALVKENQQLKESNTVMKNILTAIKHGIETGELKEGYGQLLVLCNTALNQ